MKIGNITLVQTHTNELRIDTLKGLTQSELNQLAHAMIDRAIAPGSFDRQAYDNLENIISVARRGEYKKPMAGEGSAND